MSNKPKPQQIQIEIPGDLRPTYANFAVINHSYNEIVIDFAHIVPGVPKARILNRMVLTPYHAKLLLQALQTNLGNYEKRFGEIKLRGTGLPEPPTMGFDPNLIH
ncbi:MAG: DUF3467 domain-containing protein [Caldilineae bacterium]|nr:MAG: DUF3467 domain-containing protein [Caldilineae bacterium]